MPRVEVKDLARAAAEAVDDENLDAYIDCFIEKLRPTLRRKTAILFVTHDVGLELLDSQVVIDSERQAELAVKYRTTLSSEAWDFVSLLALVREDGHWRIASEQVLARTAVSRCNSGGSCGQGLRFGGGADVFGPGADEGLPADIGRRQGGCANGRCGIR